MKTTPYGSGAELETQLSISYDLKYLSEKELFGRKGQRTFGRSKTFKKK
jgi:hypothetical protein